MIQIFNHKTIQQNQPNNIQEMNQTTLIIKTLIQKLVVSCQNETLDSNSTKSEMCVQLKCSSSTDRPAFERLQLKFLSSILATAEQNPNPHMRASNPVISVLYELISMNQIQTCSNQTKE